MPSFEREKKKKRKEKRKEATQVIYCIEKNRVIIKFYFLSRKYISDNLDVAVAIVWRCRCLILLFQDALASIIILIKSSIIKSIHGQREAA